MAVMVDTAFGEAAFHQLQSLLAALAAVKVGTIQEILMVNALDEPSQSGGHLAVQIRSVEGN